MYQSTWWNYYPPPPPILQWRCLHLHRLSYLSLFEPYAHLFRAVSMLLINMNSFLWEHILKIKIKLGVCRKMRFYARSNPLILNSFIAIGVRDLKRTPFEDTLWFWSHFWGIISTIIKFFTYVWKWLVEKLNCNVILCYTNVRFPWICSYWTNDHFAK